MDDANKKLLQRDLISTSIKKEYSVQLNLLRELVDYGTHLVLRSYNSSNKDLVAGIVIGTLLKQSIVMVDGIEILSSNGQVASTQIQIRVLHEVSLFIDWVLKEDPENKVKYYYISNLRKEKEVCLKSMNGTVERKKMDELTKKLDRFQKVITNEISEYAKNLKDEIDQVLNQDQLKSINKKFEEIKNNNGFEPNWYKVYGLRSIRQIAIYLDRLDEYEFIYSNFSSAIHSSRYKDHILYYPDKELIEFKPIRSLEDIKTSISISTTLILKIYKTVLDYFRPEESKNFVKKYMEHWRELKIKFDQA